MEDPNPLLGEGGPAGPDEAPPTLSWERVAGRSPDGCGAARRTNPVPPLFRRCGGTFPQGKVREAPAGRSPSPTGKVDRAQPGPDEGRQPNSEKQATLNGSVFHSSWPVSLLGCGPSSVTPYGVPPSPWGKATSGGGFIPSPGRGWQGAALTGVGRYRVGPGTAPLPPLRRHLPPGEGGPGAARAG